MTMTAREREIAAVGISVAAGCKPCTDHHVSEAAKAGATDDKISRAVADALNVRRKAADIMEAHALARLGGEARDRPAPCACDETSRLKAMTSVGAAFAVNCASNLQAQLAAAEGAGISEQEITEILGLAANIKVAAARHARSAAGLEEETAAADCASA
ncbi:MAG: carboxymuconolactone decarboxylase family protein [Planctomycetota bacterium]|jgi:AhpD family alkylhydroperoxidase